MKNKLIKHQKSGFRSIGFKAVAIATGSLASVGAFATTDEEVTAAFTAGEATFLLAVAGIIGLAAIGVGVKTVVGMMKSS